MELVGFSEEVKHQLRNFMSPSECPFTIGQTQNVDYKTNMQPVNRLSSHTRNDVLILRQGTQKSQ